MEYFNWDWTLSEHQFGLANLIYEDVSVSETITVDFDHVKCTPTSKCKILNCPFANFPRAINWTCISAHKLENAAPLIDGEILEQKMFKKDFRVGDFEPTHFYTTRLPGNFCEYALGQSRRSPNPEINFICF